VRGKMLNPPEQPIPPLIHNIALNLNIWVYDLSPNASLPISGLPNASLPIMQVCQLRTRCNTNSLNEFVVAMQDRLGQVRLG